MASHTANDRGDASDWSVVEGVVTTLELPRGHLDTPAFAAWRDGLGARGWTPDGEEGAPLPDATHHRYRLRHDASGCRVDALVLPTDPSDPRSVTLEDGADQQHCRYTFSTVRLYGPPGSDLLADANLADAQPDGTVAWQVSGPTHPTAEAPGRERPHRVAANPFQRRLRLPRRRVAAWAAAMGVGVLGVVLLAGIGWSTYLGPGRASRRTSSRL